MLIAQITDFHVRGGRRPLNGRFDTAAALERAIAHVNGLDPRPDLVLATGDLVNDGTDADYGVLAEIMADLKPPCFPIPGNHDDRGGLVRALGGRCPVLAGCETWIQYTIEDWPVALVAVDSVEAGESWGRLCPQRLAWLAATLERLADRPVAICLHHPPFATGLRHMDAQGLRGGGDGLARLVAGRGNVCALLSGHVHRSIQTGWHGTLASTAPSTAPQIALDLHPRPASGYVLEPPACHLHLWTAGAGLVTHVSYIGAFEGPFPFGGSATAAP